MPLVAGVDCSTQSTKVLVVDVDTGQAVATAQRPHQVLGAGGASETDPAVWRDALAGALAATGRAGEVTAVSVAGQQHGLVVSGADGEPLRPAVLWNDTRSAGEADALRDAFGAQWWATEVGVVPVPAITVTTWTWLRRVEPERARLTRALALPHDWLNGQLTGQVTTDRGDASGTGWWSATRGRLVEEVLGHPLVGIDPTWLPEVLGPTDAAGEVASADFGLRPGTPVACGTGDNAAAALGLGVPPGTPVVSLGTSGTVFAVRATPAADPTGVVAGFADATGRYLPLACTLNATLAVDRVAAWLGLDRDAVAPDSGGVVVVPFLDGERTPNRPAATGSMLGLTHQTTPGQILRSAYEGVIVSLLDALDLVVPDLSADQPIVLVGGGARGRRYGEVLSQLSGRVVEVPELAELPAMGAAAQAAGLLTGEPPDVVARRWGTRAGEQRERVAQDTATLERHRAARAGLYG